MRARSNTYLHLLCDFVNSCSSTLDLFRSFPLGFDDSLAKSYAVAVDVVAAAISVIQFDSVILSGSPFRLITLISTSTPCNFNATDYVQVKGLKMKSSRQKEKKRGIRMRKQNDNKVQNHFKAIVIIVVLVAWSGDGTNQDKSCRTIKLP